MLGLSGYDVVTELEKMPHMADIPVMFVTAKSEMEDRVMGLGFDSVVDYI
jgi:DNA-binding response OmpR family regulator